MHAVLEAAAAKAPLLLVIEDAHWADHSTRDMISFLFSRPFAEPVALVVSYRGEDLHRRHPLRAQVAEWSRVRGVERLQLNPLSDADVRVLVRELHPDPMAEAELADIVDRAEGNAFFVEELVGATWGGRVPEDLAELLLVRLDRLDETAQQVVRARRSPVAGSPTPCSRRPAGCPTTRSTSPSGPPSSPTCCGRLPRHLLLPPRPAR